MAENNLAHVLVVQPSSIPCREADSSYRHRLLCAYLSHLIEENTFVNVLGTKAGGDRQLLRLEKVYVSLKIDSECTEYQIRHSNQQVDTEMKKYYASAGIKLQNKEWDQLSAEEQLSLSQKYLGELPLSANSLLDQEVDEEEDSQTNIPFGVVFRDNPALVILGDPGSGKTTMVRWLTLKLARAFFGKLSGQSQEYVR